MSLHPVAFDALDLHRFAPISLADLEENAGLLTRTDRKYIVPTEALIDLTRTLNPAARVLEIDGRRRFRYESNYFDTPDLLTYFAAARSRPRRFKVRTRTYLDSGLCSLEVKIRDNRGSTVKHRLPYDNGDRNVLTRDGRRFLDNIIGPSYRECLFRDTLLTRYTRSTLMLADRASRVTIDSKLDCVGRGRSRVSLCDNVLIETKSINGPTEADHLLWQNHHRPVRVSKYSTSLAALQPDLPSNKWNRVLREYFEPTEVDDEDHDEAVFRLPTPEQQRRSMRLIVPKLVERLPFSQHLKI